ncbi:TPA: hypothetical protein ACT912_003229 [Enterobacter hormaechei subsp. xiangfangensis]
MSTTLNEWLQKTIAELEEERDSVPGAVNEDAAMALAAMKLALASLEADVVAWTDEQELRDVEKYGCGYLFTANPVTPNADPHRVIKLYAAPPAPVSVPEPIKRNDADGWWMYKGRRVGGGCAEWYNLALDDCRAAMLQSAEPVTTAYKLPFEQWLSQQTGTIDVECGCVMTEVFSHWLRVAYEAGNSPVIPDGWVMVPIEPTIAILDEFDSIIDYGAEDSKDAWSRLLAAAWIKSLPAAPQQEVK